VTSRSVALFIVAAVAEIGGAYLVWVGIKEHKGVAFVALGAMALTAYGVIASFQPSHEFGRVLAAYGGVFIVGSLLWGVAFDGFQPDRADVVGAVICLVGVAVIMYAR
jgi:small multidrug resistance family-3 protein